MSTQQAPQRLRPWYLVLAMCVTWVVGVFGATSGCSNLSYLRGSHQLPTALQDADDPEAHPWIRSSIVRERARLQSLAEKHREAFPLAVAQLLLFSLLVLASGAALAGRRNARQLVLQVLAANAVLAGVEWVLMDGVREAMAQAVALDTVEHGQGALPDMGSEESIEMYRSIHLWLERLRFAMLELGVFGGAAYALTRERTKQFFDAVATASSADPGDSDDAAS